MLIATTSAPPVTSNSYVSPGRDDRRVKSATPTLLHLTGGEPILSATTRVQHNTPGFVVLTASGGIAQYTIRPDLDTARGRRRTSTAIYMARGTRCQILRRSLDC